MKTPSASRLSLCSGLFVAAVLGEAKRGNRVLTDDEIVAVIKQHG